jgi:SAM-dependent methyltransferase
MRVRKFIIEDIGYKLAPCLYNRFHDPLFEFIQSKIPKDFLNKSIHDLGCGDGENTLRIQKTFQPKKILACDRSKPMLERAKKKGFITLKLDFNSEFPKGEMATFTYSLHHAYNKEGVLKKAATKFKYLFICEPYLNLFHFFNWGHVPSKKYWIKLFDKILRKYSLYEYKNNLIVFYKN